jgi:hypothetical protein
MLANNNHHDIYKNKYLKYKNKYIKLKIGNQFGGALNIIDNTNNRDTLIEFLAPIPHEIIPPKINKITYNINGNIIHIVKIILNTDDKPVLFALAGISHKSFIGTSAVILSKLDLLKKKFKELYLVEYESFREKQDNACSIRDSCRKTSEDIYEIYKPELDMNNEIADNLNEIILNLGLTNVHLLGKCNGAWVVSLLLIKNAIYKGLYLAVPGIPFNVNILNELTEDRLKEINFVFGWIRQDGYKFNWNRQSFQEKEVYDRTMEAIQKEKGIKIKYKTKMYDNKRDEDEKIYHEIFPDMIDDIISTL